MKTLKLNQTNFTDELSGTTFVSVGQAEVSKTIGQSPKLKTSAEKKSNVRRAALKLLLDARLEIQTSPRV